MPNKLIRFLVMKKRFFFLFILYLACFAVLSSQNPSARSSVNKAHVVWDDADTNDPDILQFALITDTHRYGPTADVRDAEANINAFLDYCNQHKELEFAVYGGDFMNAYDTNHEQALDCLQRSQDDFKSLPIPFYTTKGNHDCNGKQWKNNRPDNTQIITDEEYYQLFSPMSESNPLYHPEGIVIDQDNPHGNYYYRDFEKQRFRLIMLNNYDRDSLEVYGYHGLQMKWLAEVALDFSQKESPSDWCFVLVGHAFSINHSQNPITRLMHAYVHGQDFSDIDYGVSYHGNYSRMKRAKMIAMMGGHFHDDIYWNWDGYNMITFSRGFATGGEVETPERICFDHIVINTRTKTLEDRRIGRGQHRLFAYDRPKQITPVRTFDEADGLGSYTLGGTGGRIVHVTTLNDSGIGSLRWAIEQKGRRFIVFDVNGTICLKTPLVITNDSITIAGQTSPADGITLEGADMQIMASEVIIRYLKLKNGLTDGAFGQKGLLIDHLTCSSERKGYGIAIYRTENVTVQDCLIEGSPYNTTPGIIAGGYKSTYLNNLIVGCPNAIKIPDEEGTNRWIHIVRNVIENWGEHAVYGGCRQGEASLEGNLFIPGSQTFNYYMLDVAEDGTGRYYVSGNVMKGFEQYSRKNAYLVKDRSAVPYYPMAQDTLERPLMSPVQHPQPVTFTNSCLVIAAFHNTPIFKHPDKEYIHHMLQREAGSGYRPQPVCADSLLNADAESYARRLVEPERSIVVLFENDVHCNIGEYAYLAGLRDLMVADSAWVAITSSGDYLQGGLAGSASKGQAIADIMQCMNYDAITVGNHEFDFPMQTTRKLLHDIGAPVVCANLRDAEADTLVFAPYVIHQYGRRKVAYVGVTTPTIEESNRFALVDSISKKLKYDLCSRDLYLRVQRAVDQARQEGADYVIVLSHLGERNESGITSHSLIQATRGIDAVLDGHTHSFVPSLHVNNIDGKPVLIAQTGTQFAHIGKLVIDPDSKIYAEMLDTRKLMFRHPQITRITEIVQEQYMSNSESRIGLSEVEMRRYSLWRTADKNPRVINGGDLVTDAMRICSKADLAWLNPGSIRKSLPAGEITRGNILEFLPYENYVCTISITGAQIYKMVNQLIKNLKRDEEKITPVSGIRLKLKAKNKKYVIDQLEILDQKTGEFSSIDPKRMYTVATTDYCLNIGWKLQVLLKNATIHNTGMLYSDAVSQYINTNLGGIVNASSIKQKDRVALAKRK